MQTLFDPKFFNYLIMVLYMLNAGRWAYGWHAGTNGWGDVAYWLSAFAITASVTFGYNR